MKECYKQVLEENRELSRLKKKKVTQTVVVIKH